MVGMILKVQVTLSDSPLGNPYLVYNEGKKFMRFLPNPPAAVTEPMEGDPKAYFNADVNLESPGVAEIVWGERVDDQDW